MMIFDNLKVLIKQVIEIIINIFDSIINKLGLDNVFESNKKGLIIGIIVASLIFILKESSFVKTLLSSLKNKTSNIPLMDEVNNVMKTKDVSFEDAKKIIVQDNLVKNLRLSKDSWFLNDKILVVQGERVSFRDKEIGLIQGDFIGIISSELMGYDDLYVVRLTKDGSVRQAPISYVEEDTFNVYR